MVGWEARTRRLVGLAGVLLVIALAALEHARRRYDLTFIIQSNVVDWVSINTSWWVAPPAELDAQIESARAEVPRSVRRSGPMGPLVVLEANPRYFADGTGRPIYLTGSHTWSNFQDNGGSYPPPPFDYERHLDFLEAHNHNFIRLWAWEGPRWTVQTRDEDYWFHPMGPFVRTGPGMALDGRPKWDLTRFDDDYFARLRSRVERARERGIYVSVMLFNGWSVSANKGGLDFRNPWLAHPFHRANNLNGVDVDRNGDESGEEAHELGSPEALEIQEAYVRRVIDAVNDLDNVLYEISNESHRGSTEWQYHMIDLVKRYERSKPQQHPVGMTAEFPAGDNTPLFASDADWISPNGYAEPPPAEGRKVILADTDHIWGIGGHRGWVWMSLTRGVNPIFMDGYDGAGYGVGGAGFDFDASQWVRLRRNLGHARSYAERMDLTEALPVPGRCSSGYCLGNLEAGGGELLSYFADSDSIWVDLSRTEQSFAVEWLDPRTGRTEGAETIDGGGPRAAQSPFDGDVVLYLRSEETDGPR